jgi:hypothetical protein
MIVSGLQDVLYLRVTWPTLTLRVLSKGDTYERSVRNMTKLEKVVAGASVLLPTAALAVFLGVAPTPALADGDCWSEGLCDGAGFGLPGVCFQEDTCIKVGDPWNTDCTCILGQYWYCSTDCVHYC